jgi:hypothetical protein
MQQSSYTVDITYLAKETALPILQKSLPESRVANSHLAAQF